ncbi:MULTISPECIES: L-seryl-tRNA(Sec) selenium transferase [Helicobacter]|uniref:L-seryl-tRNA(Sec) selenium transferase n=1 Tax=Helicobacter ibis TaxID=2962633 RepID=A0ABT4VHL7_9HELI|nr:MULTISPECIES: L-seryl-tRNA(Sec) selenium transferase [Helicobacter]MDA3967870.1 L-seryl-tRNA(Sec) selenium transferase [Helicobacter sp. WB40]MDA3969536.1 L-seryl-tRNA(Sec) selenium transferase [Helicobacter ibis]
METIDKEVFRNIPKIDKLLEHESFVGFNRGFLKKCINKFLEIYRQELLKGSKILSIDECVLEISKIYESVFRKSLKPLINATGIVVHTNLGRSVFSEELLDEAKHVLSAYNNLEYDEKLAKRSERYIHLKEIFVNLLECEDVLVVNNNAAAVFLILNTFAKNKEVIISRGELVEIGGSFRIPQVMENAGAILKEVGTTNKTNILDYQEAINQNTAMIFKAHKSNYDIVGFSSEVSFEELILLSNKHDILDYYDLGSGFLETSSNFNVCEDSLETIAKLKPSLVSFSGDKLLGGAQAGIIFGKKKYIDQLKKNQLLRMLRVDKFTICLLESTLLCYLKGDIDKIPTAKMLSYTLDELEKRARTLYEMLPKKYNATIIEAIGYSGGGAMPNKQLKSFGISLVSKDESELERYLRDSGIIARIENGAVILDIRTIFDRDFLKIKEVLEECKI